MQIHDLQFNPMIAPDKVQARVRELGADLMARYANDKPLFISVLSGSFVFTSDLIRAFDAPCEIAFVKLASYSGTQSTGQVQTVMGLEKDLAGRHVIVVEDIVDTGRTLHFFINHLQEQQPASICTVTFLRKPEAALFPVPVDYVGFDIPDRFVVGYGLDYDGLGRNLPGIWQLRPVIEIKPFQPEQKEAVIDLILSIQIGEFGVPITRADQPDLEDIAGFYQQTGGNFWVATCAGEVVGTIAALAFDDAVAMRKMFVRQDFRGIAYGIAPDLLQTMYRWCAGEHKTAIYLGTRDQLQAAIRFYEKNDFERIEKADLPTNFPLMPVDNTFMFKQLSHE